MKKSTHIVLILIIVVLISIWSSATSALAWGGSTHAYVATKSLELDRRYVASYNARMGSIVPDFFWYLRDFGLIDQEMAYTLHGVTEEPEVTGETTYLYDVAKAKLRPWNYRLKYFTEGIRVHVYADIKAHCVENGYLEGPDRWVDILQIKTEEQDRDPLHNALEFAVDSLLVHKYGLQLSDNLVSYRQANFLEESVKDALNGIGMIPDLDLGLEFKKYLALMRVLEKAARLYAPYLIRGAVDEALLDEVDSMGLMDAAGELSEESLENYSNVLMILLKYPKEIYETINTEEMNWEDDALPEIIDFCK